MLYYALVLHILLSVTFGQPHIDQRIVGGVITSIKSVPYQVSLEYFGEHICGGAIIEQQYVVTAAHCVENIYPFKLSVRVGSSYRNEGGIVVGVCSYSLHNQYNNSSFDNDIAVLLLCRKLPVSKEISPIPMANLRNEPKAGSFALVSGWGTTAEEGKMSSKLRKARVTLIDHNQCQRMYKKDGIITSRMLCAGSYLGSSDSCQGDSGGPLVSNGKLVGIVSWGYGCGRPFHPGVYTRIATIRCWIKMLIGY